MQKFNYHMHTRFSDGKGEPSDWVKTAYDKGFTSIGFSEHSPLPFENTFALSYENVDPYIREVNRLKEQWNGKIHILSGMEMDYIPGISDGFEARKQEWGLDFLIGSVHLVFNEEKDSLWFIDGPSHLIYDDGLKIMFKGDIRKAVGAYFTQMLEMISREKFDIIGHFDKIKMHNKGRYFSEEESWYRDWIMQCLERIAEKGIIIEVNTRGIYKKRSESTFPGEFVIQEANKKGIPLTLSSDAHHMEEIDALFPETLQMLKHLGVKELYFHNRINWTSVNI